MQLFGPDHMASPLHCTATPEDHAFNSHCSRKPRVSSWRGCEAHTSNFTRDFLHISYPLCPIPSTRWLSIMTSCGSKFVLDRMRRNPFGPWQRSCHQRMVERSSWIWNHRKQSRAPRSWTMSVRIPRRPSLTIAHCRYDSGSGGAQAPLI